MTNLKPFDLEKALAGEPVVTREGEKVKIVYVSKKDKTYQVLGIIFDKITDEEDTYWFTKEGKDLDGGEYDLFMAPKTKKLWIAIHKTNGDNDGIYTTSNAYTSKEKLSSGDSFKESHLVEIEIEA
jgi:hypothetical protein